MAASRIFAPGVGDRPRPRETPRSPFDDRYRGPFRGVSQSIYRPSDHELAQSWIDSAFAFVQIPLMSRFETTFRNAVANAERDVLVDQIRANSQMSLQDLGKLATGQLGNLLNQITVADLIGERAPRSGDTSPARKSSGEPRKAASPAQDAPTGSRKAKAEGGARKAKAEGGARKPAGAEVDTRTAEGRAAYDEAVLAALKGMTKPASASDLTSVAGGSPLQIRTALARLIETGGVHWSGRARGTRYTPA